MTDLLVWSLMADGGLEMALYEALRVEIAELAEADETFEMPTCNTAIPLLHLIKQLLRYIENVICMGGTNFYLQKYEFCNTFKITRIWKYFQVI